MHMKLPVDPKGTNCRCSSAPWGEVASQSLFPNSTQVCYMREALHHALPAPLHI
jgi:hypothetical protein